VGEFGRATFGVETERDPEARLELPVFHVPEYLEQQAAVVIARRLRQSDAHPEPFIQTRTIPWGSEYARFAEME
jgi:hypothetical protein